MRHTDRILEKEVLDSQAEDESQEEETASFLPLSQGEHPISGLSSFYLHPCETATWLETIRKSNCRDLQPEAEMAAYLETFVMLCSSAVEMRSE